jgi:Ca2+-transporting ATPase
MGAVEDVDVLETTSLLCPDLRQPAPAIAIDSSSTSRPQSVATLCEEPSLPSYPGHPVLSIENRPLLSFESRLTSSHSISLPTPEGDDRSSDPHNLLAIPNTRSRGGSLDHHSISSYDGETLLPMPSVSSYDGTHGESSKAMSFHKLANGDPLRLDPGDEHLFQVEENPFAFSPGQLSKLFNPTSLPAFYALGGLQGLVRGLRTDSSSGLGLDESALDGTVDFDEITGTTGLAFPSNEVQSFGSRPHSSTSAPIRHTSSKPYVDRKRVFGVSRLPERKHKGLLQIMWMTFNDKVLIILTVVAAISLALGLYQDFGQSGRYGDGPKVRWVEGVTIMVAVAIVVVVGSLNDYQKEQQFIKLSEKVGNFPYS